MRDLYDHSGPDDDYEMEYDAPVFVFDDGEDEPESGGYESRPAAPAPEKTEYVPDYVPDYVPEQVPDNKSAKTSKANSADKAGKSSGKQKKKPAKNAASAHAGKGREYSLGSPAEFEPDEPYSPIPPKSPSDDDDEYAPVFVFDDDLTEDDDPVSSRRESRESVGGRSDSSDSRRSAESSSQDSSGDKEFVFMPFLDIKDEPDDDDDEKVTLSFSKVKTPKKEKEFVFMPFLNDEAPSDEEDERDSRKPFVSSKGTIIDEGLVLIPLESPEELLEDESKENADAHAEEDTGISLVGGEQPKMTHVPQPKQQKKSSSREKRKKNSGKRPSKSKSAANGDPDEQFRAAMNNIDPKLLASVRDDPIQMAALEQAVRIALVQQAAQAAVEKTTGRSFGYIGNYSPQNTPGVSNASAPQQRKKKRPSSGLGNSGSVFGGINPANISAPSEFGIDAKEAARIQSGGGSRAPRPETPSVFSPPTEAPSAFTPAEEMPMPAAPAAPSPMRAGFTPGPSAQQDPALAALGQGSQPLRPEDVMPDVSQDPALAHLTAGSYEQRPPESDAAPSARPQNKNRTININSPAAVRAAMRSGNSMDQIAAQNAAKASSSQAESYDAEAEQSGRSGCLLWIIILFIAFFIGLIAFAVWPALSKELDYRSATTALSEGHYIEAVEGYASLEDYKDSQSKHQEAAYLYACMLLDREYYDSALEYFLQIDAGYQDTSERIAECRYALGKRHLEAGRYADAYDQLYLIPKYQDAGDLAIEANYKAADQLMNEEKFDRAAMRFELFPDYLDSKDKYNQCQYNYAKQLLSAEQYDLAYRAFSSIGSYEDAPFYAAICQFDAIITGSTYTPEEMQGALLTLSANSSYPDAQTILETHVYDQARLVGRWSLDESYMTFEYTDGGGNRLTTAFNGGEAKVYDNVVFNDDRVLTADGQTTIIVIRRFDPYTSAQPRTVEFNAVELGEDFVFNRG